MFFELNIERTNVVLKPISAFLLLVMLSLIIGVMSIGAAQAASFDCVLAQSTSEKLICSNPDLSKLDEELAKQYKLRLKAVSSSAELKSEQRRWLKQLRAQCQDALCYIKAYNERMSSWQTPPSNELASNPIAETNSNQANKPDYKDLRFQFCKSSSAISCEETGHGYTVCEAYLKHLNSLPEDWPHGACKAWVNPAIGDISLPKWQSLDVESNLELVYQLVSFEKAEFVTFAKWQADYVNKLKSGKIYPSLKQMEVSLTKNEPPQTLVRYQEGDSVMTGCDKNHMPTSSGGSTNSKVFILNELKQPIKQVLFAHEEMLLYKSQPFFIMQVLSRKLSSISWYVGIRQPLTGFDKNYIPLTCELTNIKYGIKEAK